MAFKAGAIFGEAKLDTKKWDSGLKGMLSGATKIVGAVSAVFVAGMTKSIMSANEFQKSMSNVSTIIDETEVSTQDLTMQLLKLDPALGTTTELTDALYQAFSAGAVDAEDAMDITVQAAQFGKAALTDTATAVDVLTTAVNAYGKENMDAETASDLFFTTVKLGKITGAELSSTIGQSIPLFASMGIEMEELTSGIATMTKQGISASEATTQLNAIVNAFIKPSEEMTSALQEIGFESGAAFIESEGLAGALKFLEEQTGGNADELGQLIPNIRGLKGVMALTGEGGDIFNETLLEMADATGSTQEAFDKQEKTFETLAASMDKVQIVVGNIGKHFVDQVAVGATAAANSMLQFIMSSEGMELVANVAGVLGGLFETLQMAVQPIVDSLGPGLEEIWEAVSEAGNELAGETADGAGAFKILALAAEGVAIVLTVVSKGIATAITGIADLTDAITKSAGVVGGFFEALTGDISWDEFGTRVDEAGESFTEFGVNVVDGVGDMIGTVIDEFSVLGEVTDKSAKDMHSTYTTTFDSVSNHVRNSWGEMITGQQDFIGDLTANIEDIPNIFGEAFEEVEDKVEEGTEEVEDIWKQSYENISGMTELFWGSLSSLMNEAFEAQQAKIDNNTQEELDKLQDKFDQGLITEEQYESEKLAIEEDAAKESNKLGRKAFKAEKANKILGIASDVARSISGWWAIAPMLGPIAGPAFAGTMSFAAGAMGVAQTAIVLGQEYVPTFQTGGRTRGGAAIINEAGPEMVVLPDGSLVLPHELSNQIAANSGRVSTVINVSFAGAKISDEMDLNRIVEKVSRKLGQKMRLAG
jgi:TP901 family phage tail tape measure protein